MLWTCTRAGDTMAIDSYAPTKNTLASRHPKVSATRLASSSPGHPVISLHSRANARVRTPAITD